MNNQNLFDEVANLLQVLTSDYKYGLIESAKSNDLSLLECTLKSDNYALYGEKSPKVLFVFSFSTVSLNRFLKSQDGILFSKLLKSTSVGSEPLELSNTSILITKDISTELFEEVFKSFTIENINFKVVFLGEEFQEEMFLDIIESQNFLFTFSLQEIRNSLKKKKVFWTDYKNYLS